MPLLWKNDQELFEIIRNELYTAVVGDIMDKLGRTRQFLPPSIRPLRDDMIVVGRAMTVLEADCYEEQSNSPHNPIMSKPFGLMLEALDDLKPGEIYLCSGASPHYALWGELMSARAMQCGAAGAVMNGFSRDTAGILELDFPCFSYGPYAQDQAPRGRVIDFRCRLEIEGVVVNSGDLVMGDIDGVCIVPADIEQQTLTGAIEKARGEKTVLQAILKGTTASEAFEKYGIM